MREPGCAVGGGPPASRPRCEPSVPLVVACGTAGVPGAVGPGRPRAVRAASLRLGASSRSPARPRRRPRAPQPGPLDPPVPSTPVTRGVLCVARRVGATQARPCRRPRAPPPCQRGYCGSSTFACNSPVTISEFELASLELQRFWALLKVHAIELHAEFLASVSVVTREVAQPRATASSHAVHADRLLLSG